MASTGLNRPREAATSIGDDRSPKDHNHNFWVAVPIQPLDLGFCRQLPTTACRGAVAQGTAPRGVIPARVRTGPEGDDPRTDPSADDHRNTGSGTARRARPTLFPGDRMADWEPGTGHRAAVVRTHGPAAVGDTPGRRPRAPASAVKGTVIDRIACRPAPARCPHTPGSTITSRFLRFFTRTCVWRNLRKQLPLSS